MYRPGSVCKVIGRLDLGCSDRMLRMRGSVQEAEEDWDREGGCELICGSLQSRGKKAKVCANSHRT